VSIRVEVIRIERVRRSTERAFHFTTCSGPAPAAARAVRRVAQDLLGLCGDVADADDVPLGVDHVLAADVDRPDAPRDIRAISPPTPPNILLDPAGAPGSTGG